MRRGQFDEVRDAVDGTVAIAHAIDRQTEAIREQTAALAGAVKVLRRLADAVDAARDVRAELCER